MSEATFDPTTIPVVREELDVHRVREPSGVLRVTVAPRRRTETVALTTSTQAAEVERVPVGRVVDEARAPWHDGDVLVVPVYEERLVVERRLVLVEEVRVHVRRSELRETADLPLRRDEVRVERRAPAGTWQAVPAGAPDAKAGAHGGGRGSVATSPPRDRQRPPMRQTVVGVFDRFPAAQHAAELLRERGIADDFIRITESDLEEQGEGATPGRPAGLLDRIKHFFSGTSDDDFELSAYSEAVRRGGGVVRVEAEDGPEVETAREVLESAGAVDIDERVSEWKASGWAPDAGSTAAADTGLSGTTARRSDAVADRTDDGADQVIPVVREELAVGKRVRKAGGVRVYARTVEEPVSETVSLREERARVERRPVDRPAVAADLESLGERSIEIEESVERPVVEKTARVVEEVVVGKDVRQTTTEVTDTLRHTEVEVREFGGDEYRSDYDTRYAGSGRSWDDVEPAYRYGQTLATDERYRGRDWDAVEGDARSAWTRDHPGSAWEDVKDAVRHAWQRATR